MIDTIIFDAEGVVVDTEPLWDKSQEIFLERRGLTYDKKKLKPLMAGKSLVDGVVVMKQFYDLPGDKNDLAEERLTITRDLFASESQFIDGFLEFFEAVKHQRFKYCIATSMEKSLMLLINDNLKLTEMFHGKIFFISDVDNRSKPDPAIFVYAGGKLESEPETCVVIEDSVNGVVGAKKAKMYCIGLTTTFSREQLFRAMADRVVDSFADIPLNDISQWL